MKILILGFTKMKFMPYINFYLSNIDATKHDIHVVFWNRNQQAEDMNQYDNLSLHEFNYYQEDDVVKINKIKNFVKYRCFVNKIIKQIQFDKIIVLHTLPGVILYDKLRNFKGKFILDYRDSTYEYFSPFKVLIDNLVKWSEATFVSSDAFRKYLPETQKNKIYTSHNILNDSLSHQEDKEKLGIKSDKIRLAFWGFIRHEEINKQLIIQVAKDVRFELHYYGREQQVAHNLKTYVQEIQATNIFFHGEYKPEERYEFIKQTDCIHNLYYDNNTMLAMGNKYYDGIIFRIPQVCMVGSFMGQMCEEHNVGISLNPYDESFLSDLYAYINSVNHEKEFIKNCHIELNRIFVEYEYGNALLNSIFN